MQIVMKFIDIGVNLSDPVFKGVYHGANKHLDDFASVLSRAFNVGMAKMIITGGSYSDSQVALSLCKDDSRLFTTVGCHPTRCKEFEQSGDPEEYYKSLFQLIELNKTKVVAVGECGLDYDRLHFCDDATQKTYFEKQFQLASHFNLPMFLHHRNCHEDFKRIILRNRHLMPRGGVVHSFDGTLDQAMFFIDQGLHIGINGCSLKMKENLEVVKEIPNDKLHIETDAPWCEIKASHACFPLVKTKFDSVKKEKWVESKLVKGRNEPCCIVQVLEVIAALKEVDPEPLAEQIYENTLDLFFPQERN